MDIQFKGKTIQTVADLVSALHNLKSRDEGQQLVAACSTEMGASTASNLGYCVGYIGGSDPESAAIREQIHGFIGFAHPVFGGANYGGTQK